MKRLLPLNLLLLLSLFLNCQTRYDVVIDEIMADPSPPVGLPGSEWIELKNISNTPVNLSGWHIGDGNGQSGPMPSYILLPDSFVIVCTGSAVAQLSVFGPVIPVTGFPSLDNAGDLLVLSAANGSVIHAISYSGSWYRNTIKAEGGWTLEMIDTKNPCNGKSNWEASTDPRGGTPGRSNAADAANNDDQPPSLINAYSINTTTLILEFDEPVDSLSGATASYYTSDGGLTIRSAFCLPPLFNRIQLQVMPVMDTGSIYTITVNNVTDCKNNPVGSGNRFKTGIPEEAAFSDVVINEILFNPVSGGSDYVELYNRSSKIIDASGLYIANRNSSNAINSVKKISSIPRYIFPGEYIVITENAARLALDYLVKYPENVISLSSLPSFPDDEGYVVCLNDRGDITDEVHYYDSWHFKLIENPEGVSLEKIDPAEAAENSHNWHSAASTAGFGTPGYKNSQYRLMQPVNATINVSPKIFSPDNDGRDDLASIQYKVTEPGYVANISVLDTGGRPVKHLVRSSVLGLEGYWNWDGLDEKGLKLPAGPYIIFTEIFNLQGKIQRFKNVLILARNLH